MTFPTSLIHPKTYCNKNQVNYLSLFGRFRRDSAGRLEIISLFDSKKHNSFKRFTHDRNWGVVLSQLSINHNLYSGAEERRGRISLLSKERVLSAS